MAVLEKTVSDLARISDFLFTEAALLDRREWDRWLDLFAEGGMYWVPLKPGQTDALNHVSLFYEDAMMREVRARRLEEQRAWSQQPVVRTARTVSNIQLQPAERPGEIVVGSTFVLVESRVPHQRILAGHYTHRLVEQGDDLRIVEKKVDLIDSEAVHFNLEAFL